MAFLLLLGITPDQLCREVSGKFRSLFDEAGISYTDFIQTTELRHKVHSQEYIAWKNYPICFSFNPFLNYFWPGEGVGVYWFAANTVSNYFFLNKLPT